MANNVFRVPELESNNPGQPNTIRYWIYLPTHAAISVDGPHPTNPPDQQWRVNVSLGLSPFFATQDEAIAYATLWRDRYEAME